MRVLDLTMAIAGSIILSPLFLVIIVFIKTFSPGPALYLQKRVGLRGRTFCLYKFRTMVDNADKIGTSVTTGEDPRITRIGRILRKTKLDELPQLFNVLKGDMSFVGPRPDVPEVVNSYSPQMRQILEVRPGITSNATLYLRNEEELLLLANDPEKAYKDIFVPAKVNLAMEHVKRKSFLFDYGILIKTIWTLTGGRILKVKETPFVSLIKKSILELNKAHNHKQI